MNLLNKIPKDKLQSVWNKLLYKLMFKRYK